MRVCQGRSNQKVGSGSLYSRVLFLVLSLIHYQALNQQPTSAFLCDFCAVWQVISKGEYKILNAIFSCQIWQTTWRNTAIQVISEYAHSALQISHIQRCGLYHTCQPFLHTQVSSLCSQSSFTTPSCLENPASYSIPTPKDSTTSVLVLYMVCNLLQAAQEQSVNKLPPRISQKDKPGKYKIILRENKRYG